MMTVLWKTQRMPVTLQPKKSLRILGFYAVCILAMWRSGSLVQAQEVDDGTSNDRGDDNSSRGIMTGTKTYGKVLGIATQEIRFYYHSLPNKLQDSCDDITVLYVGVGTAMSVNGYDQLSREVVLQTNRRDDNDSGPVVVMIADASRNIPVKLFGYASLANVAYDDMSTLLAPLLLPGIALDRCDPRMVIGGHSASGGAALGDFQKGLFKKFKPAAFLGLDPFPVDPDKTELNGLATLNVGFTTTTCAVTRSEAAESAYLGTTNTDQRVLYQIRNDNAKDSGLQHCAFTDSGCGGPACPHRKGWYPFVYELVGEAASHLVRALRESAGDGAPLVFDRDQFSTITATNVTVLVGKDEPATVRSRAIETGVRYIPAAVQRFQRSTIRFLCAAWVCGAWTRTLELFAFGS